MSDTNKKLIFEAAKKLFGENGYKGTPVREIAEYAGTNIASINYYYGSKEELFKEIARASIKNTSQILSLLQDKPDSIDGLKTMLRSFLKLFCQMRIEDPSSYTFINRNLDLFIELDPETFKENIWKIKESLRDALKYAQKKKLIKKKLDAEVFASSIFSSLNHLVRDENINCKFGGGSVFDEEYRNKYINQVVDCFIDGAKEK